MAARQDKRCSRPKRGGWVRSVLGPQGLTGSPDLTRPRFSAHAGVRFADQLDPRDPNSDWTAPACALSFGPERRAKISRHGARASARVPRLELVPELSISDGPIHQRTSGPPRDTHRSSALGWRITSSWALLGPEECSSTSLFSEIQVSRLKQGQSPPPAHRYVPAPLREPTLHSNRSPTPPRGDGALHASGSRRTARRTASPSTVKEPSFGRRRKLLSSWSVHSAPASPRSSRGRAHA
jgi:hypothetical protein